VIGFVAEASRPWALSEAVAAGWRDAALTASDPDLAAIRGRSDFRHLLGRMFDRAMPSDPFVRPRRPAPARTVDP
jgi:hypothetical protein